MKSLKNLLAALAFLFAFGAALVTMGNESRGDNALATIPKFRPSDCAERTCVQVGSGPSCNTYFATKSGLTCSGVADDGYEEQ